MSSPLGGDDSEQQGLYEHFAVVADKGQTLLRLDKFLVARMEHCSRNRIGVVEQLVVDVGSVGHQSKNPLLSRAAEGCPAFSRSAAAFSSAMRWRSMNASAACSSLRRRPAGA